jgi:thioredoxin-like negative regulator of GroEL
MSNTLLVFSATWCVPCQNYKAIIKDLDPTRVVKYDIDIHDELTKQYGIRTVPTTVVLDANGAEVERFTGARPLSKIQELLNV